MSSQAVTIADEIAEPGLEWGGDRESRCVLSGRSSPKARIALPKLMDRRHWILTAFLIGARRNWKSLNLCKVNV